MSVRKRTVRLTHAARRDYDDLLLYSLGTWGESQMREYEAAIERALQRLTDYPRLGRTRDELYPGCRSLPVERHVIFYRPTNTEIIVSRILHGRQDARGAVREPRTEEPRQ